MGSFYAPVEALPARTDSPTRSTSSPHSRRPASLHKPSSTHLGVHESSIASSVANQSCSSSSPRPEPPSMST
eukprot:3175522-Lingulodinium_polyedra.AAC.1